MKIFWDQLKYFNMNKKHVSICFAQLYMECIQDLLAPEKTNIPIVEDGKSGEVSVPGATVIKIQNLDHFLELLQIGEANRHAANTNLNTESSRSHAILMVCTFQLSLYIYVEIIQSGFSFSLPNTGAITCKTFNHTHTYFTTIYCSTIYLTTICCLEGLYT